MKTTDAKPWDGYNMAFRDGGAKAKGTHDRELGNEMAEELRKKYPKRWSPKHTEQYWYIGNKEVRDGYRGGRLAALMTVNTFFKSDYGRFAQGNMFKTKQQAEDVLKKIIQLMGRFA